MIEVELQQVEQRIKQIVAAGDPEIDEVGAYIFNGSGKRMRPALFLLAAYSQASSLQPYLDAAAALELMHTASLLHDDVIDQSSTRRGKDTVHEKWENKISVLTGDYLLSRAFKILVGYRDWRLMDIIVDIVQNMTEGEMEQAFADVDTPELEERYIKWIGKKSASFFAGCCRAGSYISGADIDEQEHWNEYGYNLGIAFQLIDDLLDYTGLGSQTGKPNYGDLRNRIITLPLIRTINRERENDSVWRLLRKDGASESQITAAVQTVLESDGPEYTYRMACEYAGRAFSVVNGLKKVDEDVRGVLQGLSRDILDRKK